MTRLDRLTSFLAGAVLAACGAAAPSRTSEPAGPWPRPPVGPVEPVPPEPPVGLFDGVAVLAGRPVDPQIADAWGVNPTVEAAAEPGSAVALGASGESFDAAAAALGQGRWPVPRTVRVESFLAALAEVRGGGPAVPAVAGGPALRAEVFPSPDRPGYELLWIAAEIPCRGPGATPGPCAREARLRVQFEPGRVGRYRLVGYEPARLGAAQFAADGSGGVLVAGPGGAARAGVLYEVKRVAGAADTTVATVAVRARGAAGEAVAVERAVGAEARRSSFAAASEEARLAAVGAAFAEYLRGSYWARGVRPASLAARLAALTAGTRAAPRAAALAAMVDRAAALGARPDPYEARWPLAGMDFDHLPVVAGGRP